MNKCQYDINYLIFQSVKRVTVDMIPFARRLVVLYYMLHTSGSWLHLIQSQSICLLHGIHLQRCIECQFCFLNKGEKTPPNIKTRFFLLWSFTKDFFAIIVWSKWYIQQKVWWYIKTSNSWRQSENLFYFICCDQILNAYVNHTIERIC